MRRRGLLVAVPVLVATVGCSSAVPTATPGVDRVGATVLRYRGPEVEAVLSYRYASRNLGEDWLLLEIAMTTADNATVEIDRNKIWVRTPAGEEVPLATQEAFRAAYSELAHKLAQADVVAEPLGYFGGREERPLGFFALPFEAIVYQSTWLTFREVHVGRLYFEVPGGIQAGRWELHVELPESEVRIPFRLGDA